MSENQESPGSADRPDESGSAADDASSMQSTPLNPEERLPGIGDLKRVGGAKLESEIAPVHDEPVVDIEEGYVRFLRTWWEGSLRALAESSDPESDSSPAPEESEASVDFENNRLLSALVRDHGPERFFITAVSLAGGRDDEVADAEILSGSIPDIRLQVMLRVRARQEQGRSLQTLFKGTLAATVNRLFSEGIGTPEDHVDLIVIPLGDISFRPSRCSESLQLFMRGLWFHLERQAIESRGNGYYVTRGILADHLIAAGSKECWLQGAFYYHQTLSFVVWMAENGLDMTAETSQRVVIGVSNIAQVILNLGRRVGHEDNPRVAERRADLLRLSAVMAGRSARGEPKDYSRSMILVSTLAATEVEDPIWVPILADMASSGIDWFGDAQHLRLAFSEIASGLALLGLEDRQIGAPRSFFNAALAINRQLKDDPRRFGFDVDRSNWARAILNGLGLWWALELSGGDLPKAMVTGSGLSCGVNFLSAVSELKWSEEDSRAVRRVAEGLFSIQPLLDPERGTDFLQMEHSLRDLKMSTPKAGSPDGRGLQIAVSDVLASMLLGAETSMLPLAAFEEASATTAVICRDVVARLMRESRDFEIALVEPLKRLLADYAAASLDPSPRLLEIYGPLAGPAPATFPAVDAGDSVRYGPFAGLGLLIEGEWETTAQKASAPTLPLPELLRDDDALVWLDLDRPGSGRGNRRL